MALNDFEEDPPGGLRRCRVPWWSLYLEGGTNPPQIKHEGSPGEPFNDPPDARAQPERSGPVPPLAGGRRENRFPGRPPGRSPKVHGAARRSRGRSGRVRNRSEERSEGAREGGVFNDPVSMRRGMRSERVWLGEMRRAPTVREGHDDWT